MTSTSSFIPAPPFSTCGDQTDCFLRCRTPRCRRGVAKKSQKCDAQEPLKLRDFLQTNKTLHGVARLSACSEPILYALGIQLNLGRLLQWVVGSDQFHHAPVAGAAALNHHHTIKRLFFFSNPCKANRL